MEDQSDLPQVSPPSSAHVPLEFVPFPEKPEKEKKPVGRPRGPKKPKEPKELKEKEPIVLVEDPPEAPAPGAEPEPEPEPIVELKAESTVRRPRVRRPPPSPICEEPSPVDEIYALPPATPQTVSYEDESPWMWPLLTTAIGAAFGFGFGFMTM